MDLEQQLQAALARREPGPAPMATVMARLSSPAQSARGAQRKPSRTILFGTIVVVAVAAAMLVMRITGAPAPEARTAVLVPEPAPAPEQAAAPVSESVAAIPAASQAPAATQPVAETPEKAAVAKEPAVEVTPFTVRMKPLKNKATDAPSRAAIDSFYASVVSGLLGVSGLTLIDENSPGIAPDAPADCEITVSGEGPMPGNKFNATIDVKALSDFAKDAAKICRGSFMSMYASGDIAPACAGAVSAGSDGLGLPTCTDPASKAAGLLLVLRTMAFPPDPLLLPRLQARFLDSKLDPQLRLQALQRISGSYLGLSLSLGATVPGLHDPAIVKGAIQLVATTTDPAMRAQVWREMHGARNADLVHPLIDSLREDPDGDVRLAAVMTLTADYGEDPRARTALQAVMREDSRPDVRAFAQRAIMGDEAWKDYIASSLQDQSRPESERVAALLQQAKEAASDRRKSDELKQMFHDEGTVKALAEVLPKAFSGQGGVRNMINLLSQLDLRNHPAVIGQSGITDMLLDDLARSTLPSDRQFTISELIRRRDVPKVRTALEKIAASDPDLRLRQRAADGLKSPP